MFTWLCWRCVYSADLHLGAVHLWATVYTCVKWVQLCVFVFFVTVSNGVYLCVTGMSTMCVHFQPLFQLDRGLNDLRENASFCYLGIWIELWEGKPFVKNSQDKLVSSSFYTISVRPESLSWSYGIEETQWDTIRQGPHLTSGSKWVGEPD